MTEVVVAVFDSSLATEAALQDLGVARIPSAVVERGMSKSLISEEIYVVSRRKAREWPMVGVVVDEMHADAATGILRQYGQLNMEKRELGGEERQQGKYGRLRGCWA